MTTNISILHISDIHKDACVSYENLLESLKADCNNYTKKEGIKMPNIIVVSGDIIRGGSADEIKQQYSESEAFLEGIASYFLDGDKNRIVIVPGNHDTDWNTSRTSMENVGQDEELIKLYLSGSSDLRWSWKDLSLYRIVDRSRYDGRFDLFIDFYNSFYRGSKTYSTDPKEQFQIYDIPEFNVAIVGFNSCHNNDHLNYAGMIIPECITKATPNLKKLHEMGRLLIGVWHHNTWGRPFESNYLDKRVLSAMIERDIQIGLHGHQHICGAINEFKDVFDDKKMVIFSAGTLYGGEKSLPNGTSRQYNLIEIQHEEGGSTHHITIHSREDVSDRLYDIPLWGKGRIDRQASSSWICDIPSPQQPSAEVLVSGIMKEAEVSGDFKLAISLLRGLEAKDQIIRKVLADYLDRVEDHQLTYDVFIDPQNNREAVMLLVAAAELNTPDKMKYAINIPFIRDSEDAAIKKMRQTLTIQTKATWKK